MGSGKVNPARTFCAYFVRDIMIRRFFLKPNSPSSLAQSASVKCHGANRQPGPRFPAPNVSRPCHPRCGKGGQERTAAIHQPQARLQGGNREVEFLTKDTHAFASTQGKRPRAQPLHVALGDFDPRGGHIPAFPRSQLLSGRNGTERPGDVSRLVASFPSSASLLQLTHVSTTEEPGPPSPVLSPRLWASPVAKMGRSGPDPGGSI